MLCKHLPPELTGWSELHLNSIILNKILIVSKMNQSKLIPIHSAHTQFSIIWKSITRHQNTVNPIPQPILIIAIIYPNIAWQVFDLKRALTSLFAILLFTIDPTNNLLHKYANGAFMSAANNPATEKWIFHIQKAPARINTESKLAHNSVILLVLWYLKLFEQKGADNICSSIQYVQQFEEIHSL